MIVKKLELSDFRNIEKLSMEPFEKVNVIYGENAQGKTNLIEALWLFTGAKSFRRNKSNEFVRFGAERALLKAEFFSEGRDQSAEIKFSPARILRKNGLEMKTAAEYAGTCTGVVFTPSQMDLFREGPAERRRLADTSLCQLYPKYISMLTDYKKILEQRNTVLKDAKYHSYLLDMIDVYDRQLAKLGGAITKARVNYCVSLNCKAREIYKGMSSGREEFSAGYISTLLNEGESTGGFTATDFAARFYEKLNESRGYDMEHFVTSVGPHRDDIEVCLDGLPVRAYGSQGQQRSCILSLKLGEAKMLGETMGEAPLILLDDVMSELDGTRRDYILNSIGESQIFLTCCDKDLFKGLKDGRVYKMDKGELGEDR